MKFNLKEYGSKAVPLVDFKALDFGGKNQLEERGKSREFTITMYLKSMNLKYYLYNGETYLGSQGLIYTCGRWENCNTISRANEFISQRKSFLFQKEEI